VKQLEIHLDGASPHALSFVILTVADTAGKSFLSESDLIVFSEAADIAILPEKSNEDIRVSFSVLLRTRRVIQKCGALSFVPTPQNAECQHVGRRDFFVPKDRSKEFFA
jgi:hypothetical protein